MFEIVFLGTSASAPTIRRNVTASVVLYRQYRFLVDCGEGTQRQLLRSGIGFRRLERVLLTHGHLDHILGLAGIVSTFTRWETSEHIEIYGMHRALSRVRDLLLRVVLRGTRGGLYIKFTEIKPGIVFQDNTFQLSAFLVEHKGRDSVGYCFEERPRRPFLADRAEELGVPFGPERGQLVGGRSITLADGRVIHPDDVLGPEQPGTKFVYVGDTDRVDNLVQHVQGADALVIEATYLSEDESLTADFGHITAAQAAWLARTAGVGQLILNHISRRYQGPEIAAEAQAIFPDTVVARDFDRFEIKARRK
jgi:ribonuclease Z